MKRSVKRAQGRRLGSFFTPSLVAPVKRRAATRWVGSGSDAGPSPLPALRREARCALRRSSPAPKRRRQTARQCRLRRRLRRRPAFVVRGNPAPPLLGSSLPLLRPPCLAGDAWRRLLLGSGLAPPLRSLGPRRPSASPRGDTTPAPAHWSPVPASACPWLPVPVASLASLVAEQSLVRPSCAVRGPGAVPIYPSLPIHQPHRIY